MRTAHLPTKIFLPARPLVISLLLFLLASTLALPVHADTSFTPGAPLWAARDRLLTQYAERLGMPDACTVWNWMNQVRRGVFLTISHNLWHHYLLFPRVEYVTLEPNRCVPEGTDCTYGCNVVCTDYESCGAMGACQSVSGETCYQLGQCDRIEPPREGPYAEKLIDHVDYVYAILDGGSAAGTGDCGGMNNNRIFFSLDEMGITALRNIYPLYLPGIKQSGDAGGPHSPFNGSRETMHGQPRGQFHYFLWDRDARSLAGRREVGDVFDPWAMEMDIDYNWIHDSNPLCTYGGDLGLNDYRDKWGEGHRPDPWWPVEYNYTPGGCLGNRISEILDTEKQNSDSTPGAVIAIKGSGFAQTGNRVYFVRDALNSVGPVEPVAQSDVEIRVKVPQLLGTIYVFVEDVAGRRSNTKPIAVNPWSTVTSVNSASYDATEVAAESIVAAFGSDLATGTEAASTKPLPTTLAGTTVKVRARNGTEQLAPLFFVSPNQINYQMPLGISYGPATVTITGADGKVSTGTVNVARVAPGVYSASGDGKGLPAGFALRVKADGSQTWEAVATFDTSQQKMVPVPIDLGPETDKVFLILYGTGIRNLNISNGIWIGGLLTDMPFLGAHPDFVGTDQVNAFIPRALAGRGEVDVQLEIDGKPANRVTIVVH